MKNVKLFFRGLKKGFRNFGYLFASVVNFVLLSIVYIIGVGLTSTTAKILGKKFINFSKKRKSSHWQDKNLKKESMESYYKQF